MCFPTTVPSGTSRILPATLVNKVPSYLFIHAALKQQVLIGDEPAQMLSAYIYLLSRREENMFATVVYLRCSNRVWLRRDSIPGWLRCANMPTTTSANARGTFLKPILLSNLYFLTDGGALGLHYSSVSCFGVRPTNPPIPASRPPKDFSVRFSFSTLLMGLETVADGEKKGLMIY